MALTHTITGTMERHEQLLPIKLYSSFKTRTMESDNCCRLCHKVPESLPHVLAGCPALAQNKYLARHNVALQVLFFEMLRELDLVATTPPGYSPLAPKPSYQPPKAQTFWNIPLFAKHTHVQQNRVDARFIDY